MRNFVKNASKRKGKQTTINPSAPAAVGGQHVHVVGLPRQKTLSTTMTRIMIPQLHHSVKRNEKVSSGWNIPMIMMRRVCIRAMLIPIISHMGVGRWYTIAERNLAGSGARGVRSTASRIMTTSQQRKAVAVVVTRRNIEWNLVSTR